MAKISSRPSLKSAFKMRFQVVVFNCLILPFLRRSLCSFVSNEEASGLLQWKRTFITQNNVLLASWSFQPNVNASASIPCSWYGISCRRGSINRLNLTNSGPIPKSLKNCSSLIRVRLSKNQFSGDISEAFGIYPNLQFMDLSDNNFHGVLSKDWGSSKQLTNLWIARNNISGIIPPEIGDITQLTWLDLSGNQIVGEIPEEFEELSFLENLDLSKNMLNGSIPQYIGGFLHLLTLNLSWNGLSGPIPAGFEKLKNISFVDLSYNNLEGHIPNIMKYMNASLEGNKGLCGNMNGFEPCQSSHSSRKGLPLI